MTEIVMPQTEPPDAGGAEGPRPNVSIFHFRETFPIQWHENKIGATQRPWWFYGGVEGGYLKSSGKEFTGDPDGAAIAFSAPERRVEASVMQCLVSRSGERVGTRTRGLGHCVTRSRSVEDRLSRAPRPRPRRVARPRVQPRLPPLPRSPTPGLLATRRRARKCVN